jgi:hypothetical protein
VKAKPAKRFVQPAELNILKGYSITLKLKLCGINHETIVLYYTFMK